MKSRATYTIHLGRPNSSEVIRHRAKRKRFRHGECDPYAFAALAQLLGGDEFDRAMINWQNGDGTLIRSTGWFTV